jgi:hypothetical protein
MTCLEAIAVIATSLAILITLLKDVSALPQDIDEDIDGIGSRRKVPPEPYEEGVEVEHWHLAAGA